MDGCCRGRSVVARGGAGGDGDVVGARWHGWRCCAVVEQVEVLGGAPPRRPGRGGGRRWKKEAGERGDGDARHRFAMRCG